MALDKDRLGDAMADAVLTETPSAPGGADEAKLRTLMKKLADEILKEITTNAVVSVNVSSVSAVTPGVGVSGPGSGTGTIN